MAKVIPVIKEEAQVTKKQVTRGRVHIQKKVHEHEEVIDQETYQDIVNVERVPINQVVDTPPQVRQEGDTMIIPVVEEVLVTEKRLLLKEEVRVTRQRKEIHQPTSVKLRSEEVNVERLGPEDTPSS